MLWLDILTQFNGDSNRSTNELGFANGQSIDESVGEPANGLVYSWMDWIGYTCGLGSRLDWSRCSLVTLIVRIQARTALIMKCNAVLPSQI